MQKIIFLSLGILVSDYTYAKAELEFPFQKEFQIYQVVGDSADEIEHSFNESRPTFLKEIDFDGYTAWKYHFHADDETCEIYDFSLRVTYTLPQIIKSKTSPKSAEEFRFYLEKLYRHEQVHCAIAVKFMHDIFSSLKVGQNGRCDIANQRIVELEKELKENNELFDVYTSHGEIELAESPFGEESYLKICEIPYEPILQRL